jgi:AraC-like DNA-binding protein
LEEEDFSVEKLAEQLHLSRTQLFRKLKALTGRSVSQFVNLVRIEEAKVWLRDSELTVSEVAYRVGFAEPSYFMRVFAKETEMTAGQWREEKSEP